MFIVLGPASHVVQSTTSSPVRITSVVGVVVDPRSTCSSVTTGVTGRITRRMMSLFRFVIQIAFQPPRRAVTTCISCFVSALQLGASCAAPYVIWLALPQGWAEVTRSPYYDVQETKVKGVRGLAICLRHLLTKSDQTMLAACSCCRLF